MISKKISISIIGIFLLFKILQLINSFAISRFVQNKTGVIILITGFIFICSIFTIGVVLKKYSSKIMSYLWIFIILLIILTAFTPNQWGIPIPIVLIFGLLFYGFSSAEAELIRNMERKICFPRWLSLSIPIIILFIFYSIDKSSNLYSSIIFATQSVTAFMISYTFKEHGSIVISRGKPPLSFGLIFMAASVGLYLLDRTYPDSLNIILPFVFLFYFGGAMMVYLAMNHYLTEKAE